MTIDRPEPGWDEPRGPHLPDWVTRIPGPVWPFLAIALVVAWYWVGVLAASDWDDPGRMLVWAVSIVGYVAAPLLGAALFIRHPDARQAHRALVIGTVLIAVSQLGASYRIEIGRWLDALAGAEDGSSILRSAYGWVLTLATAAGVFALGRGLDAARAHGSRLPAGQVLLLALGIPVVTAAIGLGPFLGVGGQADLTAAYAVSSAAYLAVGLAWGSLAAAALLGAHAGEAPASGWWLATIASWGVLAVRLGSMLAGLFIVTVADASSTAGVSLSVVFTVVSSAMWVVLLAAFAAGLPLTRRPAI